MNYQINQAAATIKIEPLPDCLGDKLQINQVFSNLLNNAVSYLDDSKPGLIHISGSIDNGQSIYCIEDNGIGISAEHREKIFEVFYRLKPEKTEGEGLGLTIVRRIIDRHKGMVWFESEPEKGSRFYVALPTA